MKMLKLPKTDLHLTLKVWQKEKIKELAQNENMTITDYILISALNGKTAPKIDFDNNNAALYVKHLNHKGLSPKQIKSVLALFKVTQNKKLLTLKDIDLLLAPQTPAQTNNQ